MVDMIQLATNIEDMQEYVPLPSGPYPAEIREVEIKYSEKQPNGYFVIQVRVDPEDYPADYDVDNNPEGAILTYARVQMPDPNNRRTIAPFRNLLKATGISPKGNTFNPEDLVGKHIRVLVSENVYNGQPVNNIDAVTEIPQV